MHFTYVFSSLEGSKPIEQCIRGGRLFLIEFQPETLEEDECSRSRDGEEHLGSLMRSHVVFFAPVRARLSTQNVSHSTSITASLFFGCISRVFFCLPCGQAVRYSWCHFPNGLCGKCLLHFCQEGGVCLCAVWRLVSMLPWLSLKFVQDVLLSICGSGPDRLCESKSSGRGCKKNTAITVTGLVRQEFRSEIIPAWMVSIKKTCQSEGYVRLIFHKRWQLTSTSNKNGQSQTESDRFFVVLSGQAQTAVEILQFIHPWYYDRQLCRVMALTRENR